MHVVLFCSSEQYTPTPHMDRRTLTIRGGGTGGARAGGPVPSLELGIYRVKFLKIRKISFFLLIGPPWIKIVPPPLLTMLELVYTALRRRRTKLLLENSVFQLFGIFANRSSTP